MPLIVKTRTKAQKKRKKENHKLKENIFWGYLMILNIFSVIQDILSYQLLCTPPAKSVPDLRPDFTFPSPPASREWRTL